MKIIKIVKLNKGEEKNKHGKVLDENSNEFEIFMKNLNSLLNNKFKLLEKLEYSDFFNISFENPKSGNRYRLLLHKITAESILLRYNPQMKNYTKLLRIKSKNNYKKLLEAIKNLY